MVNGLPTISFSPYGASSGPSTAISTTTRAMTDPTMIFGSRSMPFT